MKHVIRHAESKGNRSNRLAFGQQGAPLTENGFEKAVLLGRELDKKGVDKEQPVAVSRLLRTKQTALAAGFKNLVEYAILDEINKGQAATAVTKNALVGILPQEAYIRAYEILDNPPEETYAFGHGLVIAGLREVMDMGFEGRDKVPHFLEDTVFELAN